MPHLHPPTAGPDRREFLKMATAALTWAGVGAGCSYQPREYLVPYVRQPDEFVPGQAVYFATASPELRMGLLVETQAGRPIKIEGNPDHPASLGHTDVHAQATTLQLYDPDRSQVVRDRGDPSSWSAFIGALQASLPAERERGGAGLRIITEPVHSPTLLRQRRALLAELPKARWTEFDPLQTGRAVESARKAFGRNVEARYRFERARRVLAIGSDFLSAKGGEHLRYAHDYMVARTLREERLAPDDGGTDAGEIVRLYVLESMPTVTGAKADHALRVRPSTIAAAARAVAAALGVGDAPAVDEATRRWADAVARDLRAYAGRSIVIVGEPMDADVHALGHAMNAALGNIGQTVYQIEPRGADESATWPLAELVGEMRQGAVSMLFLLGVNPVYTAYPELQFADAMAAVPFVAHLGLYLDETGERCRWHIPRTHFLEEWSDVRAFDGSVSIVQPLIFPLYNGRSVHDLIDALLTNAEGDPYRTVRLTFNTLSAAVAGGSPRPDAADDAQASQAAADAAWRRALRDGVLAQTAYAPLALIPAPPTPESAAPPAAPAPGTVDLVVAPDPNVLDGRYANSGWLQELPKELTSLTWDNAVMMSRRTAERLGVDIQERFEGGGFDTDVLLIQAEGRTVEGPAWVVGGHPDDTVTIHLGYGRRRAGRVGTGIGFDATRLRTSAAPWHIAGARVERTGRRTVLATSQQHQGDAGRDPVPVVTFAALAEGGEGARGGEEPGATMGREAGPHHPSFYPDYAYPLYRWGMAIDVNACTGCNACVIACQAENNIPVVGKEQVLRSREMQWLRIDIYYREQRDARGPEGPLFQPLMCVHCEKAPCEPVCPVHATVHDGEGLNVMVYNRCIGTRYCSNNCPYKVRRFNFLLFQDWTTEQLKMVRNPDVTVRSRGVMEKCTYCTQRIQAAKIDASTERRRIRDGEVVTACQAACPTNAIVFGDLNDADAAVTRLRTQTRRSYPLLESLNTQPRTHHLSAVWHPNPEIAPQAPAASPSNGGRHG